MKILVESSRNAINAEVIIRPIIEDMPCELPVKKGMTEAEAVTIFRAREAGQPDILLVGLGKKEKITTELICRVGGTVSRELIDKKYTNATVELKSFSCIDSEGVAALAEGFYLGSYKYTEYFCKKKSELGNEINIYFAADELTSMNETELTETVQKAVYRAEGVCLARNFVNEPSEQLFPVAYAERITEHFKNTDIKITVYKGEELDKMNFVGTKAVGRGGNNPPAFIELRYEKDTSKPLVVLIGKGITFDMGGMNVKVSRNLSGMRSDMAGSAAVAGVFDIISKIKPNVNVIGLLPVAENLPDAGALLPSSVIKYPNGINVEIANTDAEGRLLLADALIYAGKLNAAFTFDICTLTGAIGAALGGGMAGVFGDDELTDSLYKIGLDCGDKVWRMPLFEDYRKSLDSQYADICNISSQGEGGSITAALFLKTFVPENTKWAHLDIAATALTDKAHGCTPSGATGFGTRLLYDCLLKLSK